MGQPRLCLLYSDGVTDSGNIYLLPHLFSESFPKQDMWHSSNRAQPDYIREIEEFLDEPTIQERKWFKVQFENEVFAKIRSKYIATFQALQHASEYDARRRILDEWYDYAASVRANKI